MFKKFNYMLGVAWLVAVFLIPFPFIYTFIQGLSPIYTAGKIGFVNGIVAYVWMLLAIYISTRPKWLDRLIGLPAAYMIHGILSLVAIFLALFHKSVSPSDGLIQMTGNIAFNLYLSVGLYSMIFMAGWLTSRVPLLAQIKRSLEKIFKHEISLWLHRLNILATLLVFFHIQLIPYVRSNKPFMLLIYLATVFVFASYFWAKFKPTSTGIKANLISNRTIADNIQELLIQLPQNHKLKLRAGDFVFISFPQFKGMAEPHPFSIINAPDDSNQIGLAIRGDGDFTRLIQTVPAPTTVRVAGGYGMYQTVIDDQQPEELLIITGGIGVTPMLSVIEGNPHLKTTVFHGASTEAALLYGDKFAEWSKRPNFIANRVVGTYTVEDVVSYLPEDLSKVVVLVSGPPAMGRYWVKEMKAQKVPSGQIFYEEFGW